MGELEDMNSMVIGASKSCEYKFPVSWLKRFGFEPGSCVVFKKNGDGSVMVTSYSCVSDDDVVVGGVKSS